MTQVLAPDPLGDNNQREAASPHAWDFGTLVTRVVRRC
jgi:hypothetical protein